MVNKKTTTMSKKDWKDCQNLIDEWDSCKKWVDGYTKDFPELMKLADGIALSNTKGAPIVGDMTLATSVRQTSRGSIQQLPTFSVEVNGTKQSITAFICDYIVRRVVFNQDTFGQGILSTMQIGAETALTVGFQAAMASIGTSLTDFGTTMKLIHYNDLAIEKGVLDANEAGITFVRTRVTKRRLDDLIDAAEKNPETTWNVNALKALRDIGKGASTSGLIEHLMIASREGTPLDAGDQYDIITAYKPGPFAEISTFSPFIREPLRVINSKSKFGYPRVTLLVLDPAQTTPFGISRVRLASPAANYANIYLQSTAKMQLLNADPPVLQKGQFTGPVRLKRAALWKTIDPNADVELKELSNSTLTQFENVLQFVGNQIYSIMGVTPGSVAAQRSGPYQNKVASGMEKNVSELSAAQITHILENFLRQYALTALDLYVSEQVGKVDLIVDDQCKDAINLWAENKHNAEVGIDPLTGMALVPFTPLIGDDNKIEVNWKEFYDGIESWTVDIDLSMSKDTLDEKKRGDLQDMLTVISQTTDPADMNGQARKRALEDELLKKTAPELAREESAAPAAPMMAQPAAPSAPAE